MGSVGPQVAGLGLTKIYSSDEDVTDISGDEGSDVDEEPVSEAESEENSDVENNSDEVMGRGVIR